jgi:uncharacterized damage-inducible protein DinB
MDAKDAIRQNTEFGHMLTRYYLEDLSDADLFIRSVPGTNHVAWALGHIITGDAEMLKLLGYVAPALPSGFAPAYTKETASSDDPSKFHSKDEYLKLMEQTKAAVLAAIDATPDEQLGQPGPEPMREYAATVLAALMMFGHHWLMHAGQFVPIRRKLGRPPLF